MRDLPRARQARGFKGNIEFDKVSFGYNPDQSILKDVSFKIQPGQVAAFVGPTGGGKTTIINLIARFYDPVSGTVRIDGTDIRALYHQVDSRSDQLRTAGHGPVPHTDLGEHRLWAAGSHSGRDYPCRRTGQCP